MTFAAAPAARWTLPLRPGDEQVLTPEALTFLAGLARRFQDDLDVLLAERQERQIRRDAGLRPHFYPGTQAIREGEWTVAPLPADLRDRRVEITGPPEKKMLLNALNSGAQVHMSDFEDSLAPTPENLLNGQKNLQEAVRGTLRHQEGGKVYEMKEKTAVLMVRPRGLHLEERHLLVDGEPIRASLFDAGLFLFHNAKELLARGKGAYLYLPKLEHYLEARWWNRVLNAMEQELGLEEGTVKTTVLIETLPAAFQMDEILFELRTRAAGLNLGRWDYLFSVLKVHRMDDRALMPDRSAVTMTQPFLRAYTKRLVQVCHRRGVLAMGGMAAFVPRKDDPEATERAFQQVRLDKERERKDGCDGTWVAHPALVPVALEVFKEVPAATVIPEGEVTEEDLLTLPKGLPTEQGLRHNLKVGLRYLESWLRGQGCVALYGLMEDAATAEISRMQLWHWLRFEAEVDGLGKLSRSTFHRFVQDTVNQVRAEVGAAAFENGRYLEASELLEDLVTAPIPPAFLTLSAYSLLLSLPALQEIA
jgi:malate synthase